jgi:alpha-N-acetylglucosaminidase
MKDYYGKRWQLFIEDVTNAAKNNKVFDEKFFTKKIESFEQGWTKGTAGYSPVPTGDYLKVSRKLYKKYAFGIEQSK